MPLKNKNKNKKNPHRYARDVRCECHLFKSSLDEVGLVYKSLLFAVEAVCMDLHCLLLGQDLRVSQPSQERSQDVHILALFLQLLLLGQVLLQEKKLQIYG